MRSITTLMVLLFSVVCIYSPGWCGNTEAGLNKVGVRSGFSATKKREYFHQHEVFAVYGLPWEWRPSSWWGLSPQLEATAGTLHGAWKDGFIGSLGPAVTLDLLDKRLNLDLGINLSGLSRRKYDKQDFGSHLLFGAYMGINYLMFERITIGYRIQHVSLNKIFYSRDAPNPGLDLHMFSLNWQF